MDDYPREADDLLVDANASIRELADFVGSSHMDGMWDFICECDDDECLECVPLSVADYDSLRECGEPVLAVGHVLAASVTHA